MNRLVCQTFLSFICFTLGQQTTENPSPIGTGLIPDQNDALLMFSTLDGSLVAVEQKTGDIRWHQNDEPAVKIPNDSTHSSMPIFLPDPKDGSLYLFGPETEALKKLPFTIPELVASSPCRSSDGILYQGRKIDTWFNVDPVTGQREQLLGFTKAENTCPLTTKNSIFVGRTEYNIIMIDSKRKDRQWNVTFYDYSAAKMDSQSIEDYDLAHFTASSTGQVATLDRFGNILWNIDLGSPVIAMYTINKDGLITVPFNSVADNTLQQVLKKISVKPSDIKFFPTLFIGEHSHGLYALPSLVDSSTPTIISKSGKLLLEGPIASEFKKNSSPSPLHTGDSEKSDDDDYDNDIIILGHYEVPTEYRPHNQQLLITGRSDPIINTKVDVINSTKRIDIRINGTQLNGTLRENREWNKLVATYKNLFHQHEKTIFVTVLILTVSLFLIFYKRTLKEQRSEFEYQSSRENSRTSSYGNKSGINLLEETEDGLDRVGKITFNPEEILGKGCEGTFVYKGEFDGRSVAVKRLLPECFTFAEREVKLLRESDTHPNVVRYFCTEKDKQFQYIALELADATLENYVDGSYDRTKISSKSILKQATCGLAHLHSLDIVHRDIKPHNVLLSMPNSKGEVRAMISDFGLCKKLQTGQRSFSKRSGVTGTEGWIAPEVLNQENERTTCAVDIFSLGCVFYYVLSEGEHPFGNSFRRQANIESGNFSISEFKNLTQNDVQVALVLIKAMIAGDPEQRPSAQAVYDNPLFWNASQVLSFFSDVSDRVEKDHPASPALMSLERDCYKVVGTDWRLKIDQHVAEDLRRYRTYNGENVRDLLRALRNKKNHYRELTVEAQEELGEVPDQFTEYWLSRFPYLLIHSWCAMQSFRSEPTLKNYYDKVYTFIMERSTPEVQDEETSTSSDVPASPDARASHKNDRLTPERQPPLFNRLQNGNNQVNWSPNRVRSRNQQRYQKKRKNKIEAPVPWIPPPEN